ncbi:MAG: hypothetical protein V1752_04475 [Candidatus Firestonebacteria bacterium]
MKRIIRFGGNINGSSNLRNRLVLISFVIVGIILMLFFTFAALALAVVLLPAGIILLAVRKILLTGRKSDQASEVKETSRQEMKDIIEVTEYKNAEEIKVLPGKKKDGD